MGKKYQKKKANGNQQDPLLLSEPLQVGDEFEGLESCHEMGSCTFMKLNKRGKIKRELWKDGQIFRKKSEIQEQSQLPVTESKDTVKKIEAKVENSEAVVKEGKDKVKKSKELVKKSKDMVKKSNDQVNMSKDIIKKSKGIIKKSKDKVKKTQAKLDESGNAIKSTKKKVKKPKNIIKEINSIGKENKDTSDVSKNAPNNSKVKVNGAIKKEEWKTSKSTPPEITENNPANDNSCKLDESQKPKKKGKKRRNKYRDGGTASKKVKTTEDVKITPPEDSKDVPKPKVDVSAWESVFVPPEVLKALGELGFSSPTEIQKLALPPAIKGRMDIIGAAETGSSKTLAFGIPIIHGILQDRERELDDDNESGDEMIGNDEDAEIKDENDEESEDDDAEMEEDEEDEENGHQAIDLQNVEEIGFFPSMDSDEDYSGGSEDEGEVNGEGEGSDDKLGCVKVVEDANFDFMDEDSTISVKPASKPLRALIVTPTRELAIQIKKHLTAVLTYTDIKMAVIVGGLASEKQARMLKKGPEIVIGTPGRLWELIENGNEHLNKLDNISYLAIDETDRMVEQGHFEELQHLIGRINSDEEAKRKRQNFVFSATLTLVHSAPRRVQMKGKEGPMTSELKVSKLAKMIGLSAKPKVIDVTRKFGTAESLTESRINCDKEEKDYYLYYFYKQYPGRTLVFCNSIDCVRRLQNLFTLLQCQPCSLHASMHQKQRLKSLEKFSTSPKALLLATDVAARGLDIPNIQHVIHYQTPRTAETYIHRSGRTARATQEGLSVLFIDSTENVKYRQLCKTLNRANHLPPFPVDINTMKYVAERVDFARKVESLEHSHRKTKANENWFKKAAMEAELTLDEEELDSEEICERQVEAAKQKREQKNQRAQLMRMLAAPIMSSNFSGKYPTQSGALITPFDREQKMGTTSQGKVDALSVMKKESVEFTKLVERVKVEPKIPRQQMIKNKKKFKGYEKRRAKLIKEKERKDKLYQDNQE